MIPFIAANINAFKNTNQPKIEGGAFGVIKNRLENNLNIKTGQPNIAQQPIQQSPVGLPQVQQPVQQNHLFYHPMWSYGGNNISKINNNDLYGNYMRNYYGNIMKGNGQIGGGDNQWSWMQQNPFYRF